MQTEEEYMAAIGEYMNTYATNTPAQIATRQELLLAQYWQLGAQRDQLAALKMQLHQLESE